MNRRFPNNRSRRQYSATGRYVPPFTGTIGPLAQRTRLPTTFGITTTPVMNRSAHFARGIITAAKVAWVNFAGVVEANNGGVVQIRASIEYPANNFTQLLFSGSSSGTIPPGGTLYSDAVALSIPDTAQFWVRSFQSSNVGMPSNQNTPTNTGLGDATVANGTDQTMGGIVISGGPTGYWPAAIIGPTSLSTLGIIGDGRMIGVVAQATASGFTGEVESSFSGLGMLNCGMGSDSAHNFLTNNTGRAALLQNVSRMVMQFGLVDCATARTAAQIYADITSIRNLAVFAGKKFYILTVAPNTTGAWTLADGTDQTIQSTVSPKIVTLNGLILANAAGFDSVFDVSPLATLGTDPTKWNANGTPNQYTIDGQLESAFTNNNYGFVMPP